MMRRTPAWIALAAAVLALAIPSTASAALSFVKVGDFTEPTFMTAPLGDSHRLFVVEQPGTIRLVKDGVLQTDPFLDLGAAIQAGGERGLFSIAFSPNYAKNRLFYVFYTAPRAGDPSGSVVTIAAFRRSATNPDVADPTTAKTLLTVDHPTNQNHNGGQLEFGPDGYLYAGVGDGGGNNDVPNNAQNTNVLLGKMLRIQPTPDSIPGYRIPAGNPFVGGVGGAPEVWAYGLRNPWRFSFDRLSGDLVIGDVGESAREEVDWTAKGTGAGFDYGWHCREGTIPTPGVSPPCDPSGTYAPPVFEYDHSGGRCGVVGGYVVRDRDLGNLYGRYLYADLCTGEIRTLALARPTVSDDQPTGLTLTSIDSFGEDSCGHVYAVSRAGEVDRIAGDSFTPCKPPPPPPPDIAPPHLALTVSSPQRLGAARSVRAGLHCNELCHVTFSGEVYVPKTGRRYPFASLTRTRIAGRTARIAIRVSAKGARAAANAIAKHRRAWVHLVVTGRDAHGNSTRHFRSVRLIG